MTEPIFKAPLPQGEGEFVPPPPVQEKKPEPPASATDVKQKLLPYLWYVLGGAFVIGLILGIMMASGGEAAPEAPKCLLAHVPNPDIGNERFPFCGRTATAEPCILYIMNHTRYDKQAEDFFEEAQRLTGRTKYMISIENQVYSKLTIHPGYFAQIKIPSQR